MTRGRGIKDNGVRIISKSDAHKEILGKEEEPGITS